MSKKTDLDISIIIPVYNTKEFVVKCLDSCRQKDVPEERYEVIVVDDGSTDGSSLILKNYCEKHSNFQYYFQENQKQGAARNHGLGKARGNYIWFVDSDDQIQNGAMILVLDFLLKNPTTEILRIRGVRNYGGVHIEEDLNLNSTTTYTGDFLIREDAFTVNIPFHIFSREFLINKVGPMLERVYFEDNEFMARAIDSCSKFSYLPILAYKVNIVAGSTTRSSSYQRFFDLIIIIRSMIALIGEKNRNQKTNKGLSLHVARCMNSALVGVIHAPNSTFASIASELISINDLHSIVWNSGSILHIIQVALLRYSLLLRSLMKTLYMLRHFR